MKNLVDIVDSDKRLDSYLTELFSEISRSKIQTAIKKGFVKVNSKVEKNAYKLKESDVLEIDEGFLESKPILAQNIALDIRYEDDNMLVVNKPSGMLTHPTSIEKEGTLVNALLYRYGENLCDINGAFRRGIIHRLDRNTSGLLMVAKNNETAENLMEQIKKQQVEKKYLAVVNGKMEADEGIITLPIGRNPNKPNKMAVLEGGKGSITEFKVLEKFKNETFLELDLKTGRTHQIRVHLSYLRHPVFNDSLYGAAKSNVKTQEQVLQSYKLSFTKPFSDEIITLELEPDEKINKVLKYLRSK